jgi:D-beta-D-heptose 7-phosphate kinase/D-beta-D-heptose 1-phosphate adenosyltransferase
MSESRSAEAMRASVAAFAGRRVLVVGDVMLDEFVWGDAYRISPEAPVPVVHVGRRTFVPGGAGNVAANVVALGGEAVLGSVAGADLPGEVLRRALGEKGVGTGGLLADAGRPTTTKTRIVARGQQVVRVDTEERAALPEALEAEFAAWTEKALGHADACVVSDYRKGLLSEALTQRVLTAARAAGVPVVVDPKGKAYARYRGATVVTPNTLETVEAAGVEVDGMESLLRAAGLLQGVLGGAALLVTRGAEGMSLFEPGAEPVHIAAAAREVYDVTGAGDTVTATLALALAAGQPLAVAARLANYAASLVVGKVGTATITQDELRAALPAEAPVPHG